MVCHYEQMFTIRGSRFFVPIYIVTFQLTYVTVGWRHVTVEWRFMAVV